jgi:D-galacturonate reductase
MIAKPVFKVFFRVQLVPLRRDRIRHQLGPFSFFQSTMTQPKAQLDTFRGWAGKSSDISYYLNSHHMDIHAWSVGRTARPERVVAMAGPCAT